MNLSDLQEGFDAVAWGSLQRADITDKDEEWEACVYRLNRGDYQGQICCGVF